MRALVVYESMYGNTKLVAQAIGEGIEESMHADVVEVTVAPTTVTADVTLLVVGGPTHAFSMSWPSTRRDAAQQAASIISRGRGIREWLGALPGTRRETEAATFDTRTTSRITGSAARAASRRLDRLGFPLVATPVSFRVADALGPLVAGELDRARSWGRELGAEVAARRPSRPVS
ncbi:flavodoxin family protein [Promicromonospora thailandica]|uniref:Flavodoxin n=1 Tax=Promicromonospora thailandica TaxID=765201 RepID=A0A9X2G4W8_9MICO|nr:flavodoxin domain-containing protein [Promicromonospora thailandica]MCP2267175.1 Flavodoxin [Promicromonospora thailandica]BFF17521.1 flavodoxin family protein [Promicromonospora thailandica]